METGKAGKYFKYAIGEIILVVIGILIALQINNWNENRKLNEQRKELISNLITDFTDTNASLDSIIKFKEERLKIMNDFMRIINNESQTVALDSLRKMAVVFFSEINFKPTISSYNESISNGDFKLLKSKQLSQHVDTFFEEIDTYTHIYNLGGYSYFNGATWELRKNLGSLNSLVSGSRSFEAMSYKKLTYDEYISKIKEPLTTAVLENGHTIKMNLLIGLKEMKTSCDSIISTLNALEKN